MSNEQIQHYIIDKHVCISLTITTICPIFTKNPPYSVQRLKDLNQEFQNNNVLCTPTVLKAVSGKKTKFMLATELGGIVFFSTLRQTCSRSYRDCKF